MARKVDRKVTTASPDKGRDDLSTLHPEITLTVAGRQITVREYGFIKGLRLRPQLAPLVTELASAFENSEALTEDILDALGNQADLVNVAIAESADVEPSWVASLNDADGDLLMNAWWGVCGPFFVRQIVRRSAERARRAVLAGATSIPNLSPPVTGHPSSSGATPSDS